MSHTNDNKPLVTVLMPVYNAQNYVRSAIDSILSQTFQDFEFIIINDGSSDNSAELIKSYKDERIVYRDNGKNLGLIASLNIGLEMARGEFVARMDNDDISLPERLEKQLQFMNQHPNVGVCGCESAYIGGNRVGRGASINSHHEILGWMLFNASVAHPTLFIRKKVLKEPVVAFDENFPHAEDYELWSRLILKHNFAILPEVLLRYRVHEQQVTQKHRDAQILSANKVRERLLISLGFDFSAEELRLHCLIGSSTIITSLNDLRQLESWFQYLLKQNEINKAIEPEVFQKIIGKQWFDACGFTTLGITAYKEYYKSGLKKLHTGKRRLLLAKCLIRRFRKA